MRGHNAAASAAYKDAQKTVVAAPTVSLWPEWRDPDKDPPKVETEVLVLVDCGKGYCITTLSTRMERCLSMKASGSGKTSMITAL